MCKIHINQFIFSFSSTKVGKTHRVDERIEGAVNKGEQVETNSGAVGQAAEGGDARRFHYLLKGKSTATTTNYPFSRT